MSKKAERIQTYTYIYNKKVQRFASEQRGELRQLHSGQGLLSNVRRGRSLRNYFWGDGKLMVWRKGGVVDVLFGFDHGPARSCRRR